MFHQARSVAIILALVSTVLTLTAGPAGAIVGGTESTIEEHPWQVSLQIVEAGGQVHICGGSIMTATSVLTAAHCTEDLVASELVVQVGLTNIDEAPGGQLVAVSQVIDHPSYAVNELGDLSVLILESPLQFNSAVQPIKMATAAELAGASTATVSGWGDTGENIPGGWPILKVAGLDVVSDAPCAFIMGTDPDGEICAYRMGQDSCYSDSGGPLIIRNGSNQPRLAGVVSWGIECAGPTPGVYAEVPTYADWITSNAQISVPPTCLGRDATIVGTDGPDVLRGTSGVDVIVGLGGNDRIYGFDGSDIICGGAGRDRIWGGRQADHISGGDNGDRIWGNAGADILEGDKGNDRIIGNNGNDTINGGRGRVDVLNGRGGNDTCVDKQAGTVLIECE